MSKMFISRLELVNYKRMSGSGITRFVFTPDEQYALQMVLGTNGSGKSSLMNEFWPLPGAESDFGTNGRKEIDIEYKGKFYELVSSFEGKPRHEFKVDGVDLNDGGKIEMFRDLCKEHFGVTNEIRALALEKDPLTAMSPGRRRYWLVKLADTDFTYAMTAYKKLCDQHRDAQGAIKRLQKRLVDERIKLVAKETVDVLINEAKEIRDLIAEIYGLRNAEAKKGPEVLQVLEENGHDLERYGSEIDRLNVEMIETCGYSSREAMEDRRDEIKLEIHSTQQLQQHLFTEHSRVKKKYDVLVKAGTESIAELEFKRKAAEAQIEYERGYIALTNVAIEHDPVQMANVLKDLFHDLYDKISSLPSNKGLYTREKAETNEAVLSNVRRSLNELQARISRLGADISHRRDHVQQDQLTCPKCSHSWSAKASETDLKNAETMLENLKQQQTELVEKEAVAAKYMKDYSEYAESYRAVTMMMRSAPMLRNYFNEIVQNNRLIDYPSSVAAELSTMQSDLEHHIVIAKNESIVKSTSEQIELKKNLDADTLESIEAELNRLEETMGIQTKKLGDLNSELRNVEQLIAHDKNIGVLHSKMLTAYGVQEEQLKGYIYSRYQELLWALIMNLQTQLARKEDALAQIQNQQQIVDEIQYQLDEAIMNERVAKMAHIALSPTSGAIAEGLHRFVNLFTARMNRVISSIWSYPLAILPFEMDEGQVDMDYKFPFTRNDNPVPAKDVVEGSESMIDIFNFAFRMCALKQLGLGHLPLFLDEFEAAFDDIHRERAIYFVKKLLDEKAYGQIFMVSHYESNHGALSNLAQTCVLSKDNLLLPSDIIYNEHVTIN